MPKIDFPDEERRALADVAREYIRTQRWRRGCADQGGAVEARAG